MNEKFVWAEWVTVFEYFGWKGRAWLTVIIFWSEGTTMDECKIVWAEKTAVDEYKFRRFSEVKDGGLIFNLFGRRGQPWMNVK